MIAASGGEANRGIIDASVFNVMPAHARLINIARGSLVDEKALIHALQNGVIAGAGSMFSNRNPVPAALIALDNVVLQPHVASATQETRQKMSEVVLLTSPPVCRRSAAKRYRLISFYFCTRAISIKTITSA